MTNHYDYIERVIPKEKKVSISISIDRSIWLKLKALKNSNNRSYSQICNYILKKELEKSE